MGQSLVKNYVHITFSTKHRQPFISERAGISLHAYMGGICRELDCAPVEIGGGADHVHLLCLLSRKIALAELIRKVKSQSSGWIKTVEPGMQNFYWQDGYGAFSVNPAEIETVICYILNQREHHKKISFQDEYRAFLKKYHVDYDERYVWD